jgi:4'-phosphopantetheinyl transferase
MESDFNLKVAKRFLSKDEFEALTALPQTEQVQAFYRLWAGREAIIKATGSGLLTSPPSFSINMFSNSQTIEWTHSDETHHYHLEYFSLDPAYQSAFAATEKITHVVYWAWNANGPVNLL